MPVFAAELLAFDAAYAAADAPLRFFAADLSCYIIARLLLAAAAFADCYATLMLLSLLMLPFSPLPAAALRHMTAARCHITRHADSAAITPCQRYAIHAASC